MRQEMMRKQVKINLRKKFKNYVLIERFFSIFDDLEFFSPYNFVLFRRRSI